MPVPQKIEMPPDEAAPVSYLWPHLHSIGPDASIIFFAVRSDKADDVVEKIRTALPQGSLLFTSHDGARFPILTLPPCREMLTTRQLEILDLLRSNLSNKEIGRRLGLSHFTVRNHISQLLKLFNVSSRGAAVALLDGVDL